MPNQHPPSRRSLARRTAAHWPVAALLLVLGFVAAGGAVSTNTLGAGDRFEGLVRRVDRFLAGPVPVRSSRPTITITPPPVGVATQAPSARPTSSPTRPAPTDGGLSPGPSRPDPTPAPEPTPTPTPTPTPERVAVDVQLLADPEAFFKHQIDKDWCAVAGTQMVLAIHGKADTSSDFQRQLASRVREWESYDDSHNGRWGPAAMALALEAYGVPGYEVRAYDTRALALRDAARAIGETRAPVILLTWRGAHTWIMTGYRADADPAVFPDARVGGAYIQDPWYPDVSSIWGPSDAPGHFEDMDELIRNYLRWKRPEGRYPDRDGRFIAVVPTVPLAP